MDMKERLLNDMKEAMKAGDKLKTGVIRMLRAEIINKENEKPGAEVDDPAVISLIQKMIKQGKEAAEQYEKGGRPERAELEKQEIQILEAYLPPRMPEWEIKEIIQGVISETGASGPHDMGKVMGVVMKKLKETGKIIEGKQVGEIVKTLLSE